MVGADILPTLPPWKEPQPMYSPPAVQPLVSALAPYPSWPPTPTNQQQWAPSPARWGQQQQPEVAMAPTTYTTHSPYLSQQEQWSTFSPSSGQSVQSMRTFSADQTSYFSPMALPRASTEAASIRSLALGSETEAGDVPHSMVYGHPGHARAPSALSLAASTRPSATNSRTDLAIITPSGTSNGGARMLGGMVTYDGKESRLTTVAPADAISPVDGEVDPGSGSSEARHGMPPPAYIP